MKTFTKMAAQGDFLLLLGLETSDILNVPQKAVYKPYCLGFATE